MKKYIKKTVLVLCFLMASLFALAGCSSEGEGAKKNYSLNESTFFLVMSNMHYFPEQYLGSSIDLDCFVYEVEDVVTGEKYSCGVRKCSSGYGCTCGNDTVIGFILDYDGEIPAARNQSEDSSDKTWIHIAGSLESAEKVYVNVYAYANGEQTENIEQIYFYRFQVDTLQEIDGTDLAYYVTK